MPANHKLDEATLDEMADLRRRGWTLDRLAERFDIHFGTAGYHCARRGAVPLSPEGTPVMARRMLLCDQGKLHFLAHREKVKAVAIVNLRIRPLVRDDAPRPSPPQVAPPVEPVAAPIVPRRTPPKIDLNAIPSSMEQLAASWRAGKEGSDAQGPR